MSEKDSIPVTLQSLLKRVEFVGLIKVGKKPNVTNMSFVDSESWRGTFYRTWLRENHEKMMRFIDEAVEESIVALKTYKDGPFHDVIVSSLRRAKEGVINLKETYSNYPQVVTWAMVTAVNIGIQIGDSVDDGKPEDVEDERKNPFLKPLPPPPTKTLPLAQAPTPLFMGK